MLDLIELRWTQLAGCCKQRSWTWLHPSTSVHNHLSVLSNSPSPTHHRFKCSSQDSTPSFTLPSSSKTSIAHQGLALYFSFCISFKPLFCSLGSETRTWARWEQESHQKASHCAEWAATSPAAAAPGPSSHHRSHALTWSELCQHVDREPTERGVTEHSCSIGHVCESAGVWPPNRLQMHVHVKITHTPSPPAHKCLADASNDKSPL